MLSEVQKRALKSIAEQGGIAKRIGDWWVGGDRQRLKYEPPDKYSVQDWVGTQTIYALERRGMLELTNFDLYHRATRCITPAGRKALEE